MSCLTNCSSRSEIRVHRVGHHARLRGDLHAEPGETAVGQRRQRRQQVRRQAAHATAAQVPVVGVAHLPGGQRRPVVRRSRRGRRPGGRPDCRGRGHRRAPDQGAGHVSGLLRHQRAGVRHRQRGKSCYATLTSSSSSVTFVGSRGTISRFFYHSPQLFGTRPFRTCRNVKRFVRCGGPRIRFVSLVFPRSTCEKSAPEVVGF